MMPDILKIKLARIAAAAAFWIAVGILFLQSQGFSSSEAYTLISIYYFAVVLLELPTGVVGDHFSHKTALVTGHLVTAGALIALGLGGSFIYTAACLLAAATGITLISGSDTALTHYLSKNFKKDQAQVKLYTTATIVLATAVGPLLAKIDFGLPFILTGIFNLFAAVCIWSIHAPSPKSEESNIFHTAFKSLGEIKRQPIVGHLLLLFAACYGFILALKWLYNPLLEAMGIPLEYWGIIMGLSLLAPMLGIKIYQRNTRGHITVCFILFILSVIPIGFIQIAAISITALYLATALSGYLDIAIDVAINNSIKTTQRASILSLSSLLSRLLAGAYLPLAGLTMQHASFLVLMLGTGTALAVLCIVSLVRVGTRSLQS